MWDWQAKTDVLALLGQGIRKDTVARYSLDTAQDGSHCSADWGRDMKRYRSSSACRQISREKQQEWSEGVGCHMGKKRKFEQSEEGV
jgi:hypothetical protein